MRWVYDRAGLSLCEYKAQYDLASKHGINIVSEIDWDSFESYILESPDYNMQVPPNPNKENNATAMFKQMFTGYNKSSLPTNMKRPIYWKVEDAKELLENISNNPMLKWCRENAPAGFKSYDDETLVSLMKSPYEMHLKGEL